VDACVELDGAGTWLSSCFSTAMYKSNYTDFDLESHWLAQSFLSLAMVD